MWRNGRFNEPRVDYSDFNPEAEYTAKQLEAFASALLREDGKKECEHNAMRKNCKLCAAHILFEDHLYHRSRKEHLVDPLKIDPAFSKETAESATKTKGDGQAMFNRQSPEGRKVNTEEQRRRHGASYYR